MSCCLIMQNKNSIIIGADSASSYLCNNKLVRLNNTAKKLFIFGNEVMFCSGKKNVVNHIIDMIEIDGDSINKSSLQKALQDLNLPNDTNLFDIEIIICGVKNNKSYICQLSQYKNFQISYNYIDSDNIEVFAAGFKSNKCLDIAKSEFNLCNGIIEDIYINTFNKMVCDEIGGYLNTFYINNNHIKVIHKDIKLDDIILENQILQTDNRIHYVIADMLVGDLLCGNKLKIIGGKDETTGNATVVIDGNGITLDGGAITWKSPINSSCVSGLDDFQNAVTGTLGVTNITSTSVISPKIEGGYLYIANDNYSVEIDPNNKSSDTDDDYLFCIRNKQITNGTIMGVNSSGEGYFKGKISADSGNIGSWNIINGNIVYNGFQDAKIGDTYSNFGIYNNIPLTVSGKKTSGISFSTYKKNSETESSIVSRGHLYGDSMDLNYGDAELLFDQHETIIRSPEINFYQINDNGVATMLTFKDSNLNMYGNYINVPNGGIKSYEGYYVKDKRLSYCVTHLNSGEVGDLGNGGWITHHVMFDCTYIDIPLVSVMPRTLFATENIQITSVTTYGMTFMVYCPDSNFVYNVLWMAVGSIDS